MPYFFRISRSSARRRRVTAPGDSAASPFPLSPFPPGPARLSYAVAPTRITLGAAPNPSPASLALLSPPLLVDARKRQSKEEKSSEVEMPPSTRPSISTQSATGPTTRSSIR